MKTVRVTASLLYFISRSAALVVLLVLVYATAVMLFYQSNSSLSLPIRITEEGTFYLYYPFTQKVFLLGDFTAGAGWSLVGAFLRLDLYRTFPT